MAITFGPIVKSAIVGSAVCGVAIIAPIGVPVIVALTAAADGTNLFLDSVSDEVRKKKDADKR